MISCDPTSSWRRLSCRISREKETNVFTDIPYSRSLFAALLLSSAVLLIATTGAYSEDLLKQKTGQKYLGWRTAKSKFTTCDKTVLDIDGTVEKANDKCDKT